MGNTSERKVLLITNIPAPYRIPVFRELAARVHLHVLFLKAKDKRRFWQVALGSEPFSFTVCPSTSLRLASKEVVLPRGLLRVLGSKRWDAVVCNDANPDFVALVKTYRYCRRRDMPFVVWSGDHAGFHPFRNPVLRFLYDLTYEKLRKRVLLGADAIVCYGINCVRTLLSKYGLERSKVFHGTQAYPFELVRGKRSLSWPAPPVFLYVGYLREAKGVHHLLAAHRRLLAESFECELRIVGRGPFEASLRETAKEQRNVSFVGYLDGTAKYDEMSAATCVVLPTLQDSWGLVLNEAMILGKPIITTTAAAASEELTIPGRNGFVVPPGDVDALANAMMQVGQADASAMGRESAKIIARYTCQYAACSILEAVEHAIERRGSTQC